VLDVTFICTGNRCRSPFAEVALRRLGGSLPLRVTSCGTLDLEAEPSTAEMISAAHALGLDLDAHRSRHLSLATLEHADLVLGFELNHVAAAVVDGGVPAEKVFFLKEIVRLLEAVPPSSERDPESRARAKIGRAAELRSFDHGHRTGDGISDPFGRSGRVYSETATLIQDLCRRLIAGLFGVDGVPHQT
jgi:protein-tyrosine phosphatase